MSITALAKQKFGKPLAASALALSLAFAPMAANDAQAADRSASVSTAPITKTSLFDISKQAYKASQELGVVGVYVNRAHDTKYSEEKIRGLTVWLLEKQGLNNHHVVSGQASKGTTSFTIFVDGEAKQYLFSSLKLGIQTAKVDVDNAIRAARHDQTIAMNND